VNKQYCDGAEMSGHFGTITVVPKCLRSEVSYVRSVLTPAHAGSKTLHQQNSLVLNWRCWLTQVDLYNDLKMVVVVIVHV